MKKKFRIGRVISIIICVSIIRLSLQPFGDIDRFTRLLGLVVLSIVAWLFHLGAKNVFDYRINGETYYDEYDNLQYESKGGFLEHCTEAAFVFVPLCAIDTFILFGHSIAKGLYWLVPVVVIILNIISMIAPEDEDEPEDDGEWYKL